MVTNAGGPGIIIADACESRGLEVPSLSGETRERLESRLPEEASVANPVDMIASATAEDYRNALDVVLEDPGVDAVIAAFVPPMGIEAEDVSRAIRSVAEGHQKPVMAVLMGREGLPQGMAELREADIPGYIFPESAARALSAMNRYRRWRERPEGEIAEFDVARDRAEDVIAGAVRDGREWLTEMEAFDLLECYGIPVARRGLARSPGEAVAAAGRVQNRLLQNGSLRRYFAIVVASFVLLTGYSYLSGVQALPDIGAPDLAARQWLLLLVLLAAVGAVVVTRSVLLAICSLGVVGAGIAMIFLAHGAPDLALTQLLVETLTVIIVSVILLRLPGLGGASRKSRARKSFDAALALSAGALMTTLALAMLSSPLDRSITEFYEQSSYLAAHGRNIVNVILVDFRSLDTLGEIIVVASAGLAGFALIQKRRRS